MNLDLAFDYPNPWRDEIPQVKQIRPAVLSTGFTELDALLPEGGWQQGSVNELLVSQDGIGALQLMLPTLAKLSQQGRWIAWVAPPYIPYAQGLAAAGVDVSRILWVHPRPGQDGLGLVEHCLASGTCSAVLAWPMLGSSAALSRLQRAAAVGDALGLLFRPEDAANQASPINVRLNIARNPQGVNVRLLKHRARWDAGAVSFSMDQLLAPQTRERYALN